MLNEQRRQQLDVIVQQMVRNKEPDANIHTVVQDFSQKFADEQPQQHHGILDTIGDVGLGLAKGLGQVGENVSEKVLRPISNTLTGDNREANHLQALDPTNTAQKIGHAVGETLPYFFVPELEGASIAARAGMQAVGAGTIAGVQGENPIIPAATAGVLSAGFDWAKIGLKNLQTSMEKSNLRLTPSVIDKYGEAKLNNAANFIGQAAPVGGPAKRLVTIQGVRNEMEDSFQNVLQQLNNVDTSIPKTNIISELEKIPSKFQSEPELFAAAQRNVDDVIRHLSENHPDYLSASFINSAKRDMYSLAFDTNGGAVRNEVKSAIANVYKENVEKIAAQSDALIPLPESVRRVFSNLPPELPVPQFNQLYGTILDASHLLEAAASKPQTGAMTRLLARFIGGATGLGTGGGVGALLGAQATGAVVDKLPATAIKAATGKIAARVSKSTVAPKIIRASITRAVNPAP